MLIIINAVEIYIIIRTENSTRTSMALILNVSISDLFVGISIGFVKIMFAIEKGTQGNATLKEAIGITRFYLLRLSLFASVLNLIILTFVRWLAVSKPSFLSKCNSTLHCSSLYFDLAVFACSSINNIYWTSI